MNILYTLTVRNKKLEISELPAAGETLAPAAAAFSAGMRTPGAGQISLHSFQATAAQRGSGTSLKLSGMLEGGPVASLAVELLLFDREHQQAYGPLQRRYLTARSYKVIGGVRRPVWKTPLRVQASLPGGLRLLSDGMATSLACLMPLDPGAAGERSAFKLSGAYTPAGGSQPRRASAVFGSDRRLSELLVYAPLGMAQAPKAVQPEQGDRFTPHLTVYRLQVECQGDRSGTPVSDLPSAGIYSAYAAQSLPYLAYPSGQAAGSPLTFGPAGLRWQTVSAMLGEYLLGLAVSDLDGNVVRGVVPVGLG